MEVWWEESDRDDFRSYSMQMYSSTPFATARSVEDPARQTERV